jgi:esterase/lipase superfamily enzyme
LRYGRCAVRYSPIGVLAGLAELAPFYVPDETTRVERVTEFDADTFWRLAVDGRTTGERVVFTTHGYNMSFPRACRHAARLQRALGTDARVVLFSWPSDGGLLSYARDETDAAWSVTQMERVLGGLSERIGPGRLQVLAHSLGARSVTRALGNLDCQRPGPALVDQVVFVGPDIDTDVFLAGLPALRRVAQGITVYASSNDTPLKVSRQVHGYPRLGEAGAYLTVVPGVETIDVSAVPVFEVTGHLYHLYNPRAVADVVRLLRTGHGAAQRPGLRPRQRGALTYWELVADR